MTIRLTLICHALTAAMQAGRFPGEGDAIVRPPAPVAALPGPVLTSPAAVARQTAEAWAGEAVSVTALRDVDYGGWAGRSIAEVHAEDAAGLAGWLALDAAARPGSESVGAVRLRVAAWLDGMVADGGNATAISHPLILRAVIAVVLDLPVAATAAIDIAPLTVVRFSHHRCWRLTAIEPASAGLAGKGLA